MPPHDRWQDVIAWANLAAALFSALAGIASAIAAFYATKMAKASLDVSKQATKIAQESVEVSKRVGEAQVAMARAQFLLPLWQSFAALGLVDPQNPDWRTVIQVANTLDLIGVLWEGNMIEPSVFELGFKDGFILQFETIRACGHMPGLEKSGKMVLLDAPAATKLYRHLRPEK